MSGGFKHKQVLFSFAITILGYSGVFIAYTFIEPILRHSAGFSTVGITGALFAYGLGGVAGNFFAGKVPLPLLTRTMIGVMIGLIGVLAVFPYIAIYPAAAIVATFLFGHAHSARRLCCKQRSFHHLRAAQPLPQLSAYQHLTLPMPLVHGSAE